MSPCVRQQTSMQFTGVCTYWCAYGCACAGTDTYVQIVYIAYIYGHAFLCISHIYRDVSILHYIPCKYYVYTLCMYIYCLKVRNRSSFGQVYMPAQ